MSEVGPGQGEDADYGIERREYCDNESEDTDEDRIEESVNPAQGLFELQVRACAH